MPAAASPGAEEVTASAVIDQFHGALSSAWRDAAKLGFEGRRKIMAPAVARAFDTPTMLRVATGRYWKEFSADQRQALVDAFRAMTTATYAGRFEDYAGQYFETLSETPGRRGRVLVKTRLIKANGDSVAFNYLLRPVGGGWRILDIYLKGTFSELAVRRSEFSSLLAAGGYPRLLASMRDKAAQYQDAGAPAAD